MLVPPNRDLIYSLWPASVGSNSISVSLDFRSSVIFPLSSFVIPEKGVRKHLLGCRHGDSGGLLTPKLRSLVFCSAWRPGVNSLCSCRASSCRLMIFRTKLEREMSEVHRRQSAKTSWRKTEN